MITLNTKQRQAIQEHTLICYPEEMCGILVGEDFIPMKNTAENPEGNFRIAEQDLIPYLGKLTAIVHSHCYNKSRPSMLEIRTPSSADIKQQKLSGVPWLIIGTEGENVLDPIELPRTPSRNYLGRPFIWFINDCYTLVQDYYRYELGITLPDASSNRDYKSSRGNNEPFKDYIEKYGFTSRTSIENLKNGELLLLSAGTASMNHLGIYHNGNVLSQENLSIELPFSAYIGRIHRILTYTDDNK